VNKVIFFSPLFLSVTKNDGRSFGRKNCRVGNMRMRSFRSRGTKVVEQIHSPRCYLMFIGMYWVRFCFFAPPAILIRAGPKQFVRSFCNADKFDIPSGLRACSGFAVWDIKAPPPFRAAVTYTKVILLDSEYIHFPRQILGAQFKMCQNNAEPGARSFRASFVFSFAFLQVLNVGFCKGLPYISPLTQRRLSSTHMV